MMKRMKHSDGILPAGIRPALGAERTKLGVGDAVRVTVFQQPDLTTEARITERGTVAMPLVGEVKVAGLSQRRGRRRRSPSSFKKGKYLKNPQVARRGHHGAQPAGLGARPGGAARALPARRHQLAALRRDRRRRRHRRRRRRHRDGDPRRQGRSVVPCSARASSCKGGDTVNVERAPVFYIYGEVARSGAYRVEPNMTVMQAIAAGGGITPRGSDRRLKLRRAGADGKVVETDAKPAATRVKADDVIFVKEALF